MFTKCANALNNKTKFSYAKIVSNSYGFKVEVHKYGQVQVVTVEGDAAGALTSHTISLPTNTIYKPDGFFRSSLNKGNAVIIFTSLLNYEVKIHAESSVNKPFVTATFPVIGAL